MSRTAVLEAVAAMPLDEQFELIGDLWDQLVDAGWRPQPSEELVAELRRRLAEHDADPSTALTTEQVMAHLRRPR